MPSSILVLNTFNMQNLLAGSTSLECNELFQYLFVCTDALQK